jgi:hypothetical protein
MAKPIANQQKPWIDALERDKAERPVVSVLTGLYGDGTKELLTAWKLSPWERFKVLLTGKIIFHCLGESLPEHKISADYTHVRKVERTHED